LTISETEGFHAGSGIGPYDDQDSSFFPIDNFFYGRDQNDYINADGLLNGDRTYIFKLQGTYQLPWNMTLSGNYAAMTGRPFVRQVFVPGSGEILNQIGRNIFAEVRDGSRRTDSINLLDLRVEKLFQLGGSWQVGVSADIFNLLNDGAFLDIADPVFEVAPQHTIFLPPRRLMLGGKIRF